MSRYALLDASGNPVEVDSAEAARGLADGSLRAGRAMRVRHSSGRTAEIGPEQIAAALRSGRFQLDTPEDQERRDYARTHGDVGHVAVTTVASGLRGASMGSSELGEEALGIREEVERLREANPTAAVMGEIGGALLGALETGGGSAEAEGASLLSRGARAVTAPSRAVLGLGERAGAGAARLLGSGSSSVGRRIAARAVGGAVEGALQGAGTTATEVLTEEALGEDPGDIADRMIASAGLGGLLGGGFHGAGSLLAEGGRAGIARGRDLAGLIRSQYAQRTGRELSTSVGDALADTYARASSVASGHEAGTIRSLLSPQAEDIVLRGSDVLERGAGSLRRDMDAAERAYETVREGITGASKVESVERIVRGDSRVHIERAAEAVATARRMSDYMEREMRAFGGAAFGNRGGAARRRLEEGMLRAESMLEQAQRAGISDARRSAEAFAAADQARRALGSAQDLIGSNEGEVFNAFMGSRALLEDAGVWGPEVAALQRETNAAWHPFIEANGPFRSRFMTTAGLADQFQSLQEADSAAIRAYVSSLGTESGATAESMWQRRYDALASLNDAALARHGLSAEERQQALALRGALRRLRETHERLTSDARSLAQWREVAGGGGGGVLAGAIGGALGTGGLMAAPLAAAAALASPGRSIRILHNIRRISRQMDGRIVGSVRGFLGRGARTASAWGRTGRLAVESGAQAYQRRIDDLNRHADLTAITRQISDTTAHLSHAAPQTQAALQQRAARAVAYLQAARPRGRVLPGDLRAVDRPPSLDEMNRFLRIARAIDDPATVLDDLRDRRLTPEAVAAIREVYPALYQRIARAAMTELAASDARPSYQDRLQLGMLLGIPTDPSLAPAALAALQAQYAAPQEPATQGPGGGGQAPDLARGLASASDRMEARRAGAAA